MNTPFIRAYKEAATSSRLTAEHEDRVRRLTSQFLTGRLTWMGNRDTHTIQEFFDAESDVYSNRTGYAIGRQMEAELIEKFDNRAESKLQDRSANRLNDWLLNQLLPAFHGANQDLLRLQKFTSGQTVPHADESDDLRRAKVSYRFLFEANNILQEWNSIILNVLKNYAPELYAAHRDQYAEYIKLSDEPAPAEAAPEPGVTRTPFRMLLLIQLLQKEGLFPKKASALAEKKGLEFVSYLTGYTYTGHLKKANAAVNGLLKDLTGSDNRLTRSQWQERIKDIRAVKEALTTMHAPKSYATICGYEQQVLKILGVD